MSLHHSEFYILSISVFKTQFISTNVVSFRTLMLKDILHEISNLKTHQGSTSDLSEALLQGVKSKIYKPLMERQTCGESKKFNLFVFSDIRSNITIKSSVFTESLESRLEHYAKKRKLDGHPSGDTSNVTVNE